MLAMIPYQYVLANKTTTTGDYLSFSVSNTILYCICVRARSPPRADVVLPTKLQGMANDDSSSDDDTSDSMSSHNKSLESLNAPTPTTSLPRASAKVCTISNYMLNTVAG